MPKYNIFKGKRKVSSLTFTEKEIEHLKKSGYAKKRGVKLVKVK